MKSSLKYLLAGILALSVVAACYFITTRNSVKIAYVRTGAVINDYAGMKEAKAVYQKKVKLWQANIDTLENDFRLASGRYNMEAGRLSAKERQERQANLASQENNIRTYVTSLEQKAREEDEGLTIGVLNQVNAFIKEYGEQEGYDLILGVTDDGSILYGKDAIDITDGVLKALNAKYKGEATSK